MSEYVRTDAIVEIIASTASINEATGKLSTAFEMAKSGFRDVVVEVIATPTGTTNTLLWELRGSIDGTNYGIAVRSGTIANPGVGGARIHLEVNDFKFPLAKFFVKSGGAVDTYTVVANIMRTRIRESPQAERG